MMCSLGLVAHGYHPSTQRQKDKELGQPELSSKTLPQKIGIWLVLLRAPPKAVVTLLGPSLHPARSSLRKGHMSSLASLCQQ